LTKTLPKACARIAALLFQYNVLVHGQHQFGIKKEREVKRSQVPSSRPSRSLAASHGHQHCYSCYRCYSCCSIDGSGALSLPAQEERHTQSKKKVLKQRQHSLHQVRPHMHALPACLRTTKACGPLAKGHCKVINQGLTPSAKSSTHAIQNTGRHSQLCSLQAHSAT